MRKISALAAAATLTLGLPASNAWALVMGNLSVQSSLGEPLRAEVPIPQITQDEAETLRVDVAPPSAFAAKGLEYTASASSVNVEVHRREDGTAVLRLRTNQPMREPFFDLVIDASWLGGNLQRSYTMLLSPPVLQPVPVVIAPEAGTHDPEGILSLRPDGDSAAAPPARGGVRDMTRGGGRRSPAAPGGSVQVNRGDTAGRIASANLPAGVSLDQMLMAMLRANPHAFINGNVNLVRSGAVLTLPDADAAQQIPASEARQQMAVQTRDFNQYRRSLAGAAQKATGDSGSQQVAGGRVQTRVEDGGTRGAPPPDVLRVGGESGVDADAAAAAKKKQDEEAAERERELAEIQKQLDETINVATPPGEPPQQVAGMTPEAEPEPPPPPPADEPNLPPPAQPTFVPQPPAEPEPSARSTLPQSGPEADGWLDLLPEPMNDPMILGGAGLLVLLLLGYGGYRVVRGRREEDETDETTFGSSMGLDGDSMLDSSGGQQINTMGSDQSGSTSSMFYSPSQLDAGDVDPIAEADVYLAYGRDQQAEEILREALRTDSSRLGLHVKLGEILAKRGDRQAFEAVAQGLHQVTKGEGAEWESLASAGAALDPENPLYQGAGGAAAPLRADAAAPAALAVPDGIPSSINPVNLDEPSTTQFFMSTQPVDGPAATTPAPAPVAAAEPPAGVRTEPPSIFTGDSAGFSLDDFLTTSSSQDQGASVAPSIVSSSGLTPESVSSGSSTSGGQATSTFVDGAQESLQTKLELAKEFNAIGDADGARALVEEVLAEAPAGSIKDQAQRMLDEMTA